LKHSTPREASTRSRPSPAQTSDSPSSPDAFIRERRNERTQPILRGRASVSTKQMLRSSDQLVGLPRASCEPLPALSLLRR
jgi:hypothetical protein